MIIQLSQAVVLVLGVTVLVLSLWGMYSPASLMKMVSQTMDRAYGMYIAVIVRLVLGAALIIAAPVSHFPTVFLILGWIAIVAAVGLVLIGRERVRRTIRWFERHSVAAIRLWLLFGMAFGAFLVYGVL